MKKILNVIFWLSACSGLYALENQDFVVTLNKERGSIEGIVNKNDKHAMNWVFTRDQAIRYPETVEGHKWGLGRCVIAVEGRKINYEWDRPLLSRETGDGVEFVYKNEYMQLTVRRSFNDRAELVERYEFKNLSIGKISISELGIYTAFNDNYPDGGTCIIKRCHAHVWAGGSASYVNAIRMGGEGPHLGLLLTEGYVQSYSIWDKVTTHTRGIIGLNFQNMELKPGESENISWVLYWHDGWSDFFNKALKHEQFVQASTKRYMVEAGTPIQVVFASEKPLENAKCFINNEAVRFKQEGGRVIVDYTPKTPGEHVFSLTWADNKKTWLQAHVTSTYSQLLAKRVNFIMDHQQMNDESDPRYGAYMVYDNEEKRIYKNDTKRRGPIFDTDEGGERLGMGLLLAKYYRMTKDEKVLESLGKYYAFVRNKLQTHDYKVYSTVDQKGRHRHFNYPWIAQFYLEMYEATNEKTYLEDCLNTWKSYYARFGPRLYFQGFSATQTIKALRTAGYEEAARELMDHFQKSADYIVSDDLTFSAKVECNYAVEFISSSIVFLCEIHEMTKIGKYKETAMKMMPLLDSFNGRQPDNHLYLVGLKHWDGYWFGKRQRWGDTMPQYWSAISAEAYLRYYELTGKGEYLDRVKPIAESNLSLFFEDGSASCNYLYPFEIDKQSGKFFDPFANDQDWAFYYFLRTHGL